MDPRIGYDLRDYIKNILCKEFIEFIKNNPDRPWDWWEISSNPNITWGIIEANPDEPWDWMVISRNRNITLEIIEANPDEPWDWWEISSNPNITWEIIEANPDRLWDWWGISSNRLYYEKRYNKLARQHLAAFRIQSHFRRAIYNPEYKKCRDIMERQYEENYGYN